MNFFNAAQKTAADLTYRRGKSGESNATQNTFTAALIVFMCFYAPIGLCIGLMVGFLAATARNMCLDDASSSQATATVK
ncbi:MAG: hypothetical protein K0U37_04690 [Gammaproteobacteria bacterium]|nr:hypothetical protein [Gammaproteobacteria bacterium]